jgi:DNA mismatch repair protein MutL
VAQKAMPKIKQLSQHEAQKIAAGEVVERPANIVKELVENSIDAGATRISIYVEDGGKQLIRIVDNGCGMDTTDAQKCFDRHATSKITRVDELELIDTFGFRGEALASIASISKITLLTKEEQSLEGTQVIIEANTIAQVSTSACSIGTDISIADLFFNVPARKKFLKATQTEWRAIQLLFNAFCFDYPHIHFLLFSEGKQILNCPVVNDLKNRALQLFEPTTHNHQLEIIVDGHIALHGIISDHQQYRYDRSGIYFFVNKRWVKNQHLSSALIKGYTNVIPHGRYPIAAIHITVPAHEVDINIHPRKEEVKFLHPRKVEQALQQAVKAVLENNLSRHLKKDVIIRGAEQKEYVQSNFTPFDFDTFLKKENNLTPFDSTSLSFNKFRMSEQKTGIFFEEQSEFVSFDKLRTNGEETKLKDNTTENFLEFPSAHPELVEGSSGPSFENNPLNPFVLSLSKETNTNASSQEVSNVALAKLDTRLIGQYNSTYLLIEQEDGLFLVDQHAAHERILYELFSQRFQEVATIQLLFPQIITLSTQDMEIIIPHLQILVQHGILIEQCASDQLIIQSLPVHLKNESLTDIVKETISWIIECQSFDQDSFKKTINHKLQAQMACKAAVKAGDILTQEKMEQLLLDLNRTTNRFSCPHGRPTGWLLSLAEIEKKFRRRL